MSILIQNGELLLIKVILKLLTLVYWKSIEEMVSEIN